MTRKCLLVCCWSLAYGCSDSPATKQAEPAGRRASDCESSISDAKRPVLSKDLPAFFLAHEPGRSQRAFSGLEIAVWHDGFVLFAADPAIVGSELRTAHIGPNQVEQILAQIDETGFFDLDAACYTVPSGKSIKIAARLGGRRNLHIWDEVLNPNWGANIRPSPAYQAFKGMWKVVSDLIRHCRPPDSEPAYDEASGPPIIRGYDLDAPWRTKWLNAHLWRSD